MSDDGAPRDPMICVVAYGPCPACLNWQIDAEAWVDPEHPYRARIDGRELLDIIAEHDAEDHPQDPTIRRPWPLTLKWAADPADVPWGRIAQEGE